MSPKTHPPIPPELIEKWQKIVNIMAESIGVPAGLIMEIHETEIEVFIASNTKGNPYERGERTTLNNELYCETVLSQRDLLLVPNALKDPVWKNNPDVQLNMISYLGLPLLWSNGDPLGTICVLDNKENAYTELYIEQLKQFKQTIEMDLQFISQTAELEKEVTSRRSAENKIQLLNQELEQKVKKRTRQLESMNEHLKKEIIEHQIANKKIQEVEDRYRTLVGNIPGVTYRCAFDEHWTMEFISDNVEILSGYPATDFLHNKVRSYASIIHVDDQQLVEDSVMKGVKQKKNYDIEYRIVNAEGNTCWVHEKGTGIFDEQQNELLFLDGVIIDITERKQADEQLSFQASHDALTGLVNRREFEKRAKRLISTINQNENEHALCFIDIDQFKVVNDTCGHIAGDEMLRQISTLLDNVVRHRDTLARLGGDEFGVLIEHCSRESAERVAASLQTAIQEFRFSWEEHCFSIGASIGLVPITGSTVNLTELLKDADAACYMAKDKGRNRIHVYQSDDAELAQRHGEIQWATRIIQALEDDLFCLYAQPIVSLDGNNGSYYELLIRMLDEKGDIIPPGAFLPAAERYSLISRIDRWVITNTFALLVENPKFMEQIEYCSINLSGQSLVDMEFQEFVINKLMDSPCISEKICFEITETAAISNLSTAKLFITKMRALGCMFSLDDFGSGFSSFSYLKNMKVDYLKIDGMFVRDIVNDSIDHAMVKSINDIGHVMGMKTIAEFVENDEIKGMLREIGVNYVQGYGIDKPVPFVELLV